jgi:hypothetical protein
MPQLPTRQRTSLEHLIVSVLLLATTGALMARQVTPSPAIPVDAITGILGAFKTNSLVAISDAHGNKQAQDFLISLVRDRRFAETVNDIVVEWGSARYQDVIDRFVNGENIPYESLRRVWRDTTQASAGGDLPIYEEFFRAVRAVNAPLAPARRLRVLLGDPPIVWENVRSKEDHRKWIEMREWFPAALIETEVLAKQRRALITYGHGHYQRWNVEANYESYGRLTDSLVSLLEAATGTKVFIVWRDAGLAGIQPDIAKWPTPSFATVRGTVLGAADFARYTGMANDRRSIRDGKVVPVPRNEWRQLAAEDQFEAVLYLGPPSSIVVSTWTRELCADDAYMKMRMERMALAGLPPSEANALKTQCAELLRR